MSQFKLPPPLAESPLDTRPELRQLEPVLEPVQRYVLTSRRDEQQPWKDTEIDDKAVVAVEMDDGFTLWIRGDDLRRELATPSPRQRDDKDESDSFELRRALPSTDAERGIGDWALKALSVFGYKPEELAAEELAKLVDDKNDNQLKQLSGPSPAEWNPVSRRLPAPTPGQGPILLFLHGTFSSTEGSFGKLFGHAPSWKALKQAYPAGIYGYDHRTVGESPMENLLALVDKLPKGAALHLVSHSRGGLLGDLLALGCKNGAQANAGDKPFSDEQIERFPESQRDTLRKLGNKLAARKLRIERFVRVASPSRGTTLASGRMDRWLSVVSHLLSRVPVLGGTLGTGIQEFLLAVIKQRTNPETLPGLEAMMPGSALVGLLNQRPEDASEQAHELPGVLAVIAGDIEGKGPWGKLKLLLPDLFFDGDHDLVVNTGSMYGGPARKQAVFLLDQGVEVSHFNYFLQRNTANDVLAGLTRSLPIPGFSPITTDLSIAPARGIAHKQPTAADRGSRPVLFVLPGIMGSELSVGNDRIWAHVGRLAVGKLDRLALPDNSDQPDGTNEQPGRVTASALLNMAYGDLLNYFNDSHDVQAFPYDWRLSIEDSARALADALEPALARAEANGQPLAILAHSMGGLVARAMIANRPDLWRRIRHHPQGRLVMLGTPNGGSWEIVRVMVGRSSTLKKLALLDLRHNGKALLDIIGAFPGVLELLPEDDRQIFSSDFWQQLHRQDEDQRHLWTAPGHRSSHTHGLCRLAAAGKVRQKLRNAAIDPEGMIYVAGQAPATPSDVRVTDVERPFIGGREGGLTFLASPRGDSQVLWDTGPLPDVPTWYMSGVVHGDLANHADSFDALRELVQTGDTHALARQAPRTRAAAASVEMPETEPAFLPDERSLLSSALGMGPPPPPSQQQQKIQVTISHGDLTSTSRMVAVGHYCGDTIIGPEAYLDRVLDGRLRRCHSLGLYPAGIGSNGIYFNPRPHSNPRGALVVGLGKVGELTASELTDTFSNALLAYCHEVIERQPSTSDHQPPQDLEVTTLLIGTRAGGIGVEQSLAALLRGTVRANDRLLEALQPHIVRITNIRVMELWQDTAIQAAHSLPRLERDPELSGRLDCAPTINVCGGGKSGPRSHSDPEWWHRLQILAPEGKAMRFTSLTQRARAEQDLLTTQEAMVDRFVDDAISTVEHGRETSRTLYELLLPNRLKDGAEMGDNLVLVLDERSARFPWEMLEDRWSKHQRPPAIEHGLIRQLTTQTFRDQPTMATGKQALVIGDPQSDFVELPGAREEAEAVQQALIASGYQVTAQIRAQATGIVTALHGDAYQILHLAGHGVHQHALDPEGNGPLCNACGQKLPVDKDKLVSGMIIGTHMVLTPADIQQMRQVPELVFINCCHLGRTDAGAPGASSNPRQFNRLAANLAVEFIRMGVRAVIAAGWAVDDRAASTFATTFYRELMDGRSFGSAVRLAREQTWSESPNINTWGAYQCYGDPDFTLSEQSGQHVNSRKVYPYVSPSEAIADLVNLRAEARSATAAETVALLAQLDGVEERIDKALKDSAASSNDSDDDWRKRGDLAEALGLAHGEMGHFERAVTYLNTAIAADDAQASCNAVEQRARFHARWALMLHYRGETEEALEQFRIALAALHGVQLGADGELGVQRYRSLTGIYSRRVQALEPTERKEDLQALIETYDQAEQQLRERANTAPPADAASDTDTDPLDLYSRLLWLAAKLMLTGYSTQTVDEMQPAFEQQCEALAQRARAQGVGDGSFLFSAIHAEAKLLQAVHQGKLTREVAAGVVSALRDAMKRGISERERRSMLDNLTLLQTLCRGATMRKAHFHPQAEMLAGIRDTLEHGGIASGG